MVQVAHIVVQIVLGDEYHFVLVVSVHLYLSVYFMLVNVVCILHNSSAILTLVQMM